MKLLVAVVALALCSFNLATAQNMLTAQGKGAEGKVTQSRAARVAAELSPLATSHCSFTFTSGGGQTFLKYCVTANGNITQLEAPEGHEHIAVGDFSEGYGICDFNSNVAYFDYADDGDSGNWGPASVLSQNSKSVKIARTTIDGIWTLTQTITQVAGTPPLAQISMTVRNNSAIQRSIRLFRFVDVDADGVFNNNLDGTFQTSFGWNSTGAGHAFGLAMLNVGALNISNGGFALDTSSGPDPCNPFVHSTLKTQTNIDGSLAHFYSIDLGKGGSKTVRIGYKGL